MKKFKKLSVCLALSCTVFALTACQDKTSAEDTQAQTETIENTETSPLSQESENSAETSDSEVSHNDGTDYIKGTWNNNVYTNTTLGLSFTLPEGWMSASEENMEQTIGGNESVGGTNTDNEQESSSPYDFMIVNSVNNDNILLLAEDVSTAMAGDGMAEDNYLNTVKSNLVSNQQTVYTPGEITTAVIAGQEFKKMEVSVLYSGRSLTQAYYCKKAGNYMLSFIATTATGDLSGCQQIFNAMTPIV